MSVCVSVSVFCRLSVTLHDLFVRNVECELPSGCQNEPGQAMRPSHEKHDDPGLKIDVSGCLFGTTSGL